MGADEVLTQVQARGIYDEWLSDERVLFLQEPLNLDKSFRGLTQLRRAAPKDWADSYLISFAQAAGLQLVTFDKAMSHRDVTAVHLPME
jgi:predicted nucleic acid-binding protein